ncbi:MAG: hypothetical protein NUV61_01665 [Candidatus Azambacteria bacterium]|nr:hypothetical protein [Candidatus Azambacteria bacterium]
MKTPAAALMHAAMVSKISVVSEANPSPSDTSDFTSLVPAVSIKRIAPPDNKTIAK